MRVLAAWVLILVLAVGGWMLIEEADRWADRRRDRAAAARFVRQNRGRP
jgi:hypothetical protein